MFHGVGLYIFDRLITSLSCHTSVYVMHLSKKDLRSWLKGSLSWSKSECETVRPCIWCTSCLTTVSHLSQESLMLWLEANVSAYHQRIMIQNLLEHCWTEGLSFWKAIRPQVFSCVFWLLELPVALLTLPLAILARMSTVWNIREVAGLHTKAIENASPWKSAGCKCRNEVQQCECKRVNFLQLFRNVYFWDDFYELWSHIGHIGHAFITMPLSPPCTFSADTGEPIDFNRLSSGGSRPARPRPPTDLWWHTTLNGTDQYRVLVSMFTDFHSSICHRFSQF